MKKSFLLGAGLIAAFSLVAVPPAQAACGFGSQPVAHGFTTVLNNCPDHDPVSFYAYLISNPAGTNSNGQDGVCEAAQIPNGIGQTCDGASLRSGIMGDNAIAVQYDWGSFNAASIGCPSPAGDVEGGSPIAIVVQANDGSGAIITIGYDVPYAGYELDLAFPLDLGTGLPGDGTCSPTTAPNFVSASGGTTPGTAASIKVHFPPAAILSDCDPNAGGQFVGTCPNPANMPTTAPGRLYLRTAPCKSSPSLRLADWGLPVGTADGQGNFDVPITRPAATTDCAFIGATTMLDPDGGGPLAPVETAGITGSLQIPGSAAATDHVKIDKAAFVTSKLVVDFSTTDEMTIVGFNVYAGTSKLNASLIPSKGPGSNPYVFEVGRGAVKSNRTVTVEAVTTNGSVIKSDPATLK